MIQGLKAQDEKALNICINKYHSYVSCIVANIIGRSFPKEDQEERVCFIKYYYYQKPIRVISEETGINESTIKSKLARGRNKLRELLESEGYQYEDINI